MFALAQSIKFNNFSKVIQTYQDDRPSSSANSVCSRHSKSPNKGKEYFFGKETLDSKYKNSNPDVETDSLSSLDDVARSDSSLGSIKYSDHMTLTVSEQHFKGFRLESRQTIRNVVDQAEYRTEHQQF